MTRRRARLYILLLFALGLGVAATLVLLALRDNLSYFRTPTEIVIGQYPERQTGRGLRLGGLVERGSLKREGNSLFFRVTDLKNSLPAHYQGVPPDLFREGQGVVAEGKVSSDGVFEAERLLAKHDEKYMPPEVAKALRE
ncbi:MAG: cytochrome c maturation protein CcmE [Alphaproteobacteria bacterium]|nr:cytochrome c maturation protein CcmE [Alphaproteobacteria bacterium]